MTNDHILKAIAYLHLVMAEHSDKLWTEDMRDLSRAATILESLK